jgi:hypothetical protein
MAEFLGAMVLDSLKGDAAKDLSGSGASPNALLQQLYQAPQAQAPQPQQQPQQVAPVAPIATPTDYSQFLNLTPADLGGQQDPKKSPFSFLKG